jgi:hypothetical protein
MPWAIICGAFLTLYSAREKLPGTVMKTITANSATIKMAIVSPVYFISYIPHEKFLS